MSPSPIRLGMSRTVMPGVSIGTRKIEMPSLPGAVRASRKQVSAAPAYDVQIFWPSTR
jgi:hypothetical protein